MGQRERSDAVVAVVDNYGIEPSYNSYTGVERYIGVMEAVIDGEQPSLLANNSLDELLSEMANGIGGEYPRDPVLVVDLETGSQCQPVVQHRVTLQALNNLATTNI